MFWARPELDMLAEHYRKNENKQGLFEINSAIKFIESEYAEMIPVLPSLVPQSITFEYLWTILPPDCLIVSRHQLDFNRIMCARNHRVQQMDDGVFLVINAEYIAWNGTMAGNVGVSLRIPLFPGVKLISELPCIPLKYHPRRDEVIQEVRERSQTALDYWQPNFRHEEHHGTGLAEVYEKVEPYPVSLRVRY